VTTSIVTNNSRKLHKEKPNNTAITATLNNRKTHNTTTSQ